MSSRRRLPFWPLTAVLFLASTVSVVLSLAFGSERIPVGEVVSAVTDRLSGTEPGPWDVIVWELRLPRALMAVVAPPFPYLSTLIPSPPLLHSSPFHHSRFLYVLPFPPFCLSFFSFLILTARPQ